MAELLIFHHAQGLTAGCRAFGERMTAAGHTLEEGIACAEEVQIHIMEDDPLASPPEIDLETARHLDATLEEATFFAYPGDRHLFADDSLPAYDAGAAQQAEARVLELLDPLD